MMKYKTSQQEEKHPEAQVKESEAVNSCSQGSSLQTDRASDPAPAPHTLIIHQAAIWLHSP